MVQKVGIIGAGQMGNGIAHVFALAGYDVVMSDISQENLDQAMETIRTNIARQTAKGRVSEEDAAAALARIKPVIGLDGFSEVDLAIEAATENEEIKKKIFQDLCPKLKPDEFLGDTTTVHEI